MTCQLTLLSLLRIDTADADSRATLRDATERHDNPTDPSPEHPTSAVSVPATISRRTPRAAPSRHRTVSHKQLLCERNITLVGHNT